MVLFIVESVYCCLRGQRDSGKGRQVLVTTEGFSSPRKVGVQDGGARQVRSEQPPASQSQLGPEQTVTQPLESGKVSHSFSYKASGKLPCVGGGGPKNWPDRKPIWSPLVVQAVASLSFNK